MQVEGAALGTGTPEALLVDAGLDAVDMQDPGQRQTGLRASTMAMRMICLLGDTLYRMKSGTKPPRLIWSAPNPTSTWASTPLDRAQIVVAAVRPADAEGPAAVSIRHVAAALGVRPCAYTATCPARTSPLER